MPYTPLAIRRSVVIAALSLLAASLPAAPLRAQEPPPTLSDARLQGVVVDEKTYQPVTSATVSLVGTGVFATTGRWGAFAFPDAPVGAVSVRVSAPGHPSVVQDVDVRSDGVVFVQIVLPSVAAVLSELLVRGDPPDGVAAAARTAADLLAIEVPRTHVSPSMVGQNDYRIRLRETTSLNGSTDPLILIDGVAVAGENVYDALLSIPASDVHDIQILKGPATAALYPYAANGVINVRTKRGGR